MHIDYYVSLNSPWTHLGAARIEAMAMASNATTRIYPVDFGAIFAKSGGLPLPQRSPQRQAYRLQELARWRDHLNIPIHIRPKFFPANEQLSAGCVIAVRETMGDDPAIKLAHRILKALWQEEKNPRRFRDPGFPDYRRRSRCQIHHEFGQRSEMGRTASRRHSERAGPQRVRRPKLCHRR